MIIFNKNRNFSSNKVCKLLEDNKLLEIPNTSEKSTVWQKFLYLNHIESKDYIGYVICKSCKQALKHNKSTSETTHLNDHLKQGSSTFFMKSPLFKKCWSESPPIKTITVLSFESFPEIYV